MLLHELVLYSFLLMSSFLSYGYITFCLHIHKLVNICVCAYSLLCLSTYLSVPIPFLSVDLSYHLLSFSFSLMISFSISFRARLLPTNPVFVNQEISLFHLHFWRIVLLDVQFLVEFYCSILNILFHCLLAFIYLMKNKPLILLLFPCTEFFFHCCF